MKTSEQIVQETIGRTQLAVVSIETARQLVRRAIELARVDHVYQPIVTVSREGTEASEGIEVYDIGFLADSSRAHEYDDEGIANMVADFRRVGWDVLADAVADWWVEMNRDTAKPTAVIFHQEPHPDLSTPWPVVVDREGDIVHGRPDAESVIGVIDENRVLKHTADEIIEKPELAVGFYPLFSGRRDGFFSSMAKISGCTPYSGDLDTLRESESRMRKVS